VSSLPDDPSNSGPWDTVTALAAGLAHEIKNPLSTINLNLQLLQEDWQEADSPRHARSLKRLQTVARETQRLQDLLDDFLRFARMPGPDVQPCDLHALIDETLDFVRPHSTAQGVDIRTHLDPGVPTLQADPRLLKQALLNLIVNAQQAMPDGGELLICTRRLDSDEVQIELTDTGEGIPNHLLPKVFDVYFSTKDGGSGLGLATVRRILDLHGGSVAVTSEVHQGTRFTLTLPLQQEPSQEA
jgi:signal transduction histidine kinase